MRVHAVSTHATQTQTLVAHARVRLNLLRDRVDKLSCTGNITHMTHMHANMPWHMNRDACEQGII